MKSRFLSLTRESENRLDVFESFQFRLKTVSFTYFFFRCCALRTRKKAVRPASLVFLASHEARLAMKTKNVISLNSYTKISIGDVNRFDRVAIDGAFEFLTRLEVARRSDNIDIIIETLCEARSLLKLIDDWALILAQRQFAFDGSNPPRLIRFLSADLRDQISPRIHVSTYFPISDLLHFRKRSSKWISFSHFMHSGKKASSVSCNAMI